MKMTFEKTWVERKVKYICSCGHKFTRKNRDWFTMSPFNTKTFHQCYEDYGKACAVRIRNCPKCDKEVKPVKQPHPQAQRRGVMNEAKLSEIIHYFPKGLGLFIGAKAKTLNKRYCFGQPQLKRGTFVFVDSLEEGINKFGMGHPEFPLMFIDTKKRSKPCD